ncbi:MAG: hypothetical protein GF393_03500, partial [Armatimonadia bacterium]|nr:hypothetical protein [Armatimonadia bacterium]
MSRPQIARKLIRALVLSVAVVVFAALAGCGGEEIGTIDQIEVTQYRPLIDESADVVRVVGLARNTGEKATPEVELIVTLRSRTGSFKGQNRVPLSPLEGGAEEEFSVAINSHGSVEKLEMQVVEPGTVVDEGGEETPTNSAEEGDD